MSFIAPRLTRVLTASKPAFRQMSGHGTMEEAAVDMTKWKKYSLMIAAPICGTMTLVQAYVHFSHHHEEEEEKEQPSYMKVRTKPYPWACPDCGFFDGKCWEACNAAKAE